MLSRASAHNPACTHATRAITAATVRIDSNQLGQEFKPVSPSPGLSRTRSAAVHHSSASGAYSSNYRTWQFLDARIAAVRIFTNLNAVSVAEFRPARPEPL